MRVAKLSDLPVGLVWWRSPAPRGTVVVKTTYTIARSGRAESSRVREELTVGHASTPNDFVPRKAACDVIVCGHARAATPTCEIPYALRVDEHRFAGVATSKTPAMKVPLGSGALPIDPPGWLVRTLPAGYDFSHFNQAPPDRRMPRIASPMTTLWTRGLFGDGGGRVILLPPEKPRVWYRSYRNGKAALEVALACDTFVVFADEALCTLTWRGTLEPNPDVEAHLVVACEAESEPSSWSEVRARLYGARWEPAIMAGELSQVHCVRPDDLRTLREATREAHASDGDEAR